MLERIWPLDDEACVFADGVAVAEHEQRGGAVGGGAVAPAMRAPHAAVEAPRRLTARAVLGRGLLRRSKPATHEDTSVRSAHSEHQEAAKGHSVEKKRGKRSL